MAYKKRKTKRRITSAAAHIKSTFNNTTVTIADRNGEVVIWTSAGQCGFKGTKKGTPYAAQLAAAKAAQQAMEMGIKEVAVYVKGPGPGRESAIRALQGAGLAIRSIKDVTPIPHNGCRPKKQRRV